MENNYVHWRTLTDLTKLRAECLLPGQELVLTIKDVKAEEIKNEKTSDIKPVAYFEEPNVLPMVLNVVNCETIEKLYGTGNICEWVGKKIQVFATTTKVGGEIVPCLRIKAVIPTSSTPEYKCSFCGQKMSKDDYEKTVKKFGKAYCCKDCYDKDTNTSNIL